MQDKILVCRPATSLLTAFLLLAHDAYGQQSLRPGFFSHEPQGVVLRIGSANLGYLCSDTTGPDTFCGEGTKITVTGRDSCTGTDGTEYPCTRYGYRFDYTGATAGDTIECRSTRRDPFRSQSMDYSLSLDTADGSVLQPSWIPYAPVERGTMLTEVHDCSYQGQKLATIEFIVNYEPETNPAAGAPAAASGPASGVDEPYIAEIPDSCADLSDATAASILRADSVQASGGNENIAGLSSQCAYSSGRSPFRTVSLLYKFMPYEMFDSNKLSKTQLIFNATVTGGGARPYKVIEDLGKFTFLFETAERTTVLVVTGMQGPARANEPTEFVAFYYLEDPATPHAERLDALLELARARFRAWVEMSRKP